MNKFNIPITNFENYQRYKQNCVYKEEYNINGYREVRRRYINNIGYGIMVVKKI